GTAVDRALVLAQPEQGWSRHPGRGRIAQLPAHRTAELPIRPELSRAASVGPENRRPQRLAIVTSKDDAVHLAGEADRRDRIRMLAGGFPNCAGGGAPPMLRVRLGPSGSWRRHRIRRLGAADDGAVDIEDQGLERTRAYVDAKEQSAPSHGSSR